VRPAAPVAAEAADLPPEAISVVRVPEPERRGTGEP